MIASLIALAVAGTTPLQTPTRFGLTQQNGRWWFTDPTGKPFWSLGVCCTDPGIPWSGWNPANRGYAAYRLFDTSKEWVETVQNQLHSMGFNSLGGWSEIEPFAKHGGKQRMPYFTVLHLGAYNKAPWNDMFAKDMETWIEFAAKEQIPKIVKDPYLVGYFTDNELDWWPDTLFVSYLNLPPKSPGRVKLFQALRTHYAGSFTSFKRDWNTTASTFADLPNTKTTMTLREGGNGMRFVDKWIGTVADKYYSLTRTAIKRHDPKRLIMGDRYIQFFSLPVVKASVKYVDVVSTNKGADWNNGDYARFYFDTLYQITKKPIVVTEFYVGAMENRSGNKNTGDYFPRVQTQEERARVFKRCVEQFANHPAIIGAHWFQYFDEPEHGRGDGENWNMGLVDIHGKLYEELAASAKSLNVPAMHAAARAGAALSVFPKAPAKIEANLRDWDKERGFVKPVVGPATADLYAAQDEANVYLGLYSMEYIDETLYPGVKIPESERPTFRVAISGGPSFVVRFGGKGRKATISKPGIEVFEKPDLRHTVVVRVPKSMLPKDKLSIVADLVSHGRGSRMGWRADGVHFK